MIDETQMPIAAQHAFNEKLAKLLVLLPLRTIYFRTFQCETPCMSWQIGPGRFGCFFMLSLPNENLKKNPSVRTKKFRKPYGMELGYMEQGITFLC